MTTWIFGNSDGIGLALTRNLLAEGREVVSVSRSPLPEPIAAQVRHHEVLDVTDPAYGARLTALLDALGTPSVCVWCIGVGDALDLGALAAERRTFAVNLMAAVETVEHVLPRMLEAGEGHVVTLSSQADRLISAEAPSYSASKAALSSYMEGLALAVRDKGVRITNVRLGFVDTKMAKSPVKPFMMTPEAAAALIQRSLTRRPIRVTRPLRMAAVLTALQWFVAAQIGWLSLF